MEKSPPHSDPLQASDWSSRFWLKKKENYFVSLSAEFAQRVLKL